MVETIVRALVADQDAVSVQADWKGSRTVICVSVSQANKDHGILVGRHGRNAVSVRNLLSSLSSLHGHTYELDLGDGIHRAPSVSSAAPARRGRYG